MTPPRTSSPTDDSKLDRPTATTAARLAAVQALDDALLDARRMNRRPGYRARLRDAVGAHVNIGTIRVLRAIAQAGDDVPSIADVAERLLVDPSTASRLVDQQVSNGYVERERHPVDGRRAHLTLTDRGHEIFTNFVRARRGLVDEATAGWGEDDLRRLTELLLRLREGFLEIENA